VHRVRSDPGLAECSLQHLRIEDMRAFPTSSHLMSTLPLAMAKPTGVRDTAPS
jgi:hypothetical protein